MEKPLSGIKIVELARVLAGPWCGQLLADLGADVVKVERPGTGDDTRLWGPPFVLDGDGHSLGAAYFHAANRGKRSISVDLTTAEGRDAILREIADADVVIENYKVGGLVKYGLDAASLARRWPRLVVCSITGFGQDGPYAQRPGYDFVIQGIGGFMSINGDPDGPPQKAGLAYADLVTGVYAAVAILAALRRRDAEGSGAHIDMALLDTQVSMLSTQALSWMVSGTVPTRMGNGHNHLVPYQAYATLDGEVIIAVGNDAQFTRLCRVLDLPQHVESQFDSNAARVEHRTELLRLLQSAIAPWRKKDLTLALDAVGIPAGPINRIDEAFADPQVRARGMALTLDGIPGVACPIVIDGERMSADHASPPLAAADSSPLGTARDSQMGQ